MTKYNQLFKQQVVNFYFEHHENLAFTLKHFSLAAKIVRCWIAQYKYSGTNRLAVLHRKRLYSPEFKHSIFQSILFGIASSGTINSNIFHIKVNKAKLRRTCYNGILARVNRMRNGWPILPNLEWKTKSAIFPRF